MTESSVADECQHRWRHMASQKFKDADNGYLCRHVRIDTFFCEVCLEQKDVKKEEWSRKTPDWYKGSP